MTKDQLTLPMMTDLEVLQKLEWSSYEGCAPMYMGGQPMHNHPHCPICRNIKTGEDMNYLCYSKSAPRGHRVDCQLDAMIKKMQKPKMPERTGWAGKKNAYEPKRDKA